MTALTFCLWILAVVVGIVTTVVLLAPASAIAPRIHARREHCVLYIGSHRHPEAVTCADGHAYQLHPRVDLGPIGSEPGVPK